MLDWIKMIACYLITYNFPTEMHKKGVQDVLNNLKGIEMMYGLMIISILSGDPLRIISSLLNKCDIHLDRVEH